MENRSIAPILSVWHFISEEIEKLHIAYCNMLSQGILNGVFNQDVMNIINLSKHLSLLPPKEGYAIKVNFLNGINEPSANTYLKAPGNFFPSYRTDGGLYIVPNNSLGVRYYSHLGVVHHLPESHLLMRMKEVAERIYLFCMVGVCCSGVFIEISPSQHTVIQERSMKTFLLAIIKFMESSVSKKHDAYLWISYEEALSVYASIKNHSSENTLRLMSSSNSQVARKLIYGTLIQLI